MSVLTVIVAVLSSCIISAAITIKIAAEAMRTMQKHVDEMCNINVEQCGEIKRVALEGMEKALKASGYK